MSTMTKDPNVLMKRWMEVYMNLCILRSTDAHTEKRLSNMKDALAECNEKVMAFFDLVDADPEKA